MKVSSVRKEDVFVVSAEGEVDAVTCGDLQKALDDLLAQGAERIILDLVDVAYISSAGLRVILGVAQKLYGKNGFAICRAREEVLSILEMVGLASIIPMCPTLDEAMEKVRA